MAHEGIVSWGTVQPNLGSWVTNKHIVIAVWYLANELLVHVEGTLELVRLESWIGVGEYLPPMLVVVVNGSPWEAHPLYKTVHALLEIPNADGGIAGVACEYGPG